MKFINLKPLTIQRLKAYRKMLEARVAGYEVCWCGSGGCTYAAECAKDNPNYINLRTCLDRVNKELARKQMEEHPTNPAHVPTVKEDNKRKNYYVKRKKRRAKRADDEKRPIVTFHFEQKGFNAHTADGKFTYDNLEGALKSAKGMMAQEGFSNVKVNGVPVTSFNYVEKRLANMIMTPDKYSREDLHKIKNCLCFIRDCTVPEDLAKAEKFLKLFVEGRENGVPFDTVSLELACGIKN
jgi:uncharacterized protein YxeA